MSRPAISLVAGILTLAHGSDAADAAEQSAKPGLAATGNAFRAEELMKQTTTSNVVSTAAGKDIFQPLDLKQVRVGGELGRRMEITANNNLLKIDMDKDFLAPFVGGKYTGFSGDGPYLGTGWTLDGMVRLAANTRNPELLAVDVLPHRGPEPGSGR